MKKLILLHVFAILYFPFLLAQNTPRGGEWTIVETFDIPGKASGLAWDGEFLYFGIYGANGDEFYRVDPSNGGATLLFTHPEIGDSYGMTFDGENLWVVNQPSGSSNPSLATELDFSGNTLSTIVLPDHYMSGIGWDDGDFWVCTYYPDPGTVYNIDDQGTVLQQFSPPVADQLWDVCVQDENLWFVDYNGDLIYKTDKSGAIIEQHNAENIKPSGVVWDGSYLWYVDGQLSSPSTLYKIDLGGAGTPEINVPETYHDFGTVTIGDSAIWNIQVNNIGNADLVIENLTIENAVFLFTYEVFPQTIEAGGTTELELIYKPTEVSMLYNLISIESSDPVTPEVELELHGEAVLSGPVFYIDEYAHDYGTVRKGALTRQFLSVSNIGDENLIIESVVSNEAAFYVDQIIEFPLSLSPLDVFNIGVWFNPEDEIAYEGVLTLTCNDPQTPTPQIDVMGKGLSESFEIGEEFWHYNISGNYDNSPKAICTIQSFDGSNHHDVIVCSEDNFVRRFNAFADGTGDVLWGHEIYSGNVYQNEALAQTGDIDGDGANDLVVGTTGADKSVIALSGKTGEQIWKFQTSTWGDGGWVYEVDATRDFTEDGVADVLACAGGSSSGPGANRVFCVNGIDGSLVWAYYFGGPGFSVIAIDDVNGDGIPEALAGASDANETQGKTVCVDGSTGYEIWTEYAEGSSVWALVQLDDINSDGVNDVASGEFGSGDYKVFDATNGDVLFDGSIGGGYVIITDMIKLDDVNSDGYADFTLQSSSSSLVVIDGYQGGTIWLTSLADQAQKVNRIPDISGDNINDVVVGTLYQNNYVYFIDGVNGDVLQSVAYPEPVDALSSIPDINGDISWEVVAGGRQGKVVCYSGGLNAWTSTPETSPIENNSLLSASPNPFVDQCVISINSTEFFEGNLSIISAGGRMVKDFGHQKIENNKIEIVWNGKSASGALVNPGLYFVVLSNGRYSKVVKLIKQI